MLEVAQFVQYNYGGIWQKSVEMANFSHFSRVLVDSHMQRPSPWPLHIGTLEAWDADDFWLSENFADLDINEGSFEVIKTLEEESVKMKYSWIRVNF